MGCSWRAATQLGERRQGIAGGGSWWVGTPLAALRSGFAGPWRARALAAKLAAPEGSAHTLAASQWFKRTSLPAVARSAHARAAQPPHKSLPADNPLPPFRAAVRGPTCAASLFGQPLSVAPQSSPALEQPTALRTSWIPAFAGMTERGRRDDDDKARRPIARRSTPLLARGRRCLAGAISVALEASRLERARAARLVI